jgi:hypothetical protein
MLPKRYPKKASMAVNTGYPDQNVWDYDDDHFYGIEYASENQNNGDRRKTVKHSLFRIFKDH